MSKHTPGPWELGIPEIQGNGLHVPINAESHGELAMVVWQMEDDRHDRTPSVECEANAFLIAAAPDLLVALQAFERINELWLPATSDAEHEDEIRVLHKARNDMLTAIAKATSNSN